LAEDKNLPSVDDFDEANASALSEMIVDPVTSEPVKLQIINMILEAAKNLTFFETMLKEEMTKAKCPHCKHVNHWLIPEDELNQMGWVTHEKDKRVSRHTTVETCEEYAEACSKKKVTT